MKNENAKTDDNVKVGMKIEAGESETNASFASNQELLNDAGDEENSETNISPEELELLDSSGITGEDEEQLRTAELDNKDTDGELLNVSSSADDKTGRDLDVPGSGDDDDMEDIGEEDEENNPYSISDNND
jgi:hypothetical protein